MIMKLVSYYDKKLGVFQTPISMNDFSVEDLIEQTRRLCANPKIPDEYFDLDLYILGSFDDKLGHIIVNEKPEFVVSLNDFRYFKEEHVNG